MLLRDDCARGEESTGGHHPPARRLREARELLREHAPEVAADLERFARSAAGDAARRDAILRNLLLSHDDAACSAFAVAGAHTADGTPLFGRNWDYRPRAGRGARICLTAPRRGLAHLGFTNHPIGRYGGINEAGLAVGTAIVPARPRGTGLRFTLITRSILGRCRGVQEACCFLQSVPHASAINYLLMDPTGDIARVEAEPDRVRVRPCDGFAAISNHFTSEAEGEARPRLPKSRARVRALHRWFRVGAGRIDTAAAEEILADRRAGICARGDPAVEYATVTLWSWIARPGRAQVRVAEGSPHRVPYQTVRIPRRTAPCDLDPAAPGAPG